MDFIFRQKYRIPEQPVAFGERVSLMLAEPEATLAALYARHLRRERFAVSLCSDIMDLYNRVDAIQPRVIVVNPVMAGKIRHRLLARIIRRQPALSVITVTDTITESDLRRLMKSGIASHLNRKFSRPRDIVVLAKQVMGM